MLIPVLVEPSYTDSYWARKTLKGINQECAKRKYRPQMLRGEDFRDVDYNALFEGNPRIVIVMGITYTWMPDTLQFFSDRNIDAVLVSFDPAEAISLRGLVRMDYVRAMRTLLNYMVSCGKKRIALYGFNDNTSSDVIKIKAFREWQSEADERADCRIIPDSGTLEALYRAFYSCRDEFDAVICSNDIAATSLMSRLHEDGISVPDALFVASFGNSVLAHRMHPSITSVSVDHEEMGRQAVMLFSYLSKQEVMSNVSVRVRSRLVIRESTAGMPYESSAMYRTKTVRTPENDLYRDEEVTLLMSFENTLMACDEVDEALLHCLMKGEPLEPLEGKYFLTMSAIQYRKKRLMNLAGCQTGKDLQSFLAFCAKTGLLS